MWSSLNRQWNPNFAFCQLFIRPLQVWWRNALGAARSTTSGTERLWTPQQLSMSPEVCSGGWCWPWYLPGLCSMFAPSGGSRQLERSESHYIWLISCGLIWSIYECSNISGSFYHSAISQAVYITSTLPYAVLTIFLIRGLTLKGSVEGVKFLFTPDVSTDLTDINQRLSL